MKIGIAINGEGRGHFSRARALAEILMRRHEISFWVPKHLAAELGDLFPNSPIHVIPYLKFVQKGFSIDFLKTIAVNAKLFLRPGSVYVRIAEELRADGIAALLSDFEPFSARAAKLTGVPVLQLNHPGIVTRFFSPSPATIVSQLVSLYMMSYSDRTILCSFFGGDIGPIIRAELRSKPVTRGDYFVVYQKPMYAQYLEPVLETIGRNSFRVFPDPKADYAASLAGSRGLIAPAGHQSISEALALGKPVFAIPVEGQFEQELNARKLRESGFGDFSRYEDLGRNLPRFIESLTIYENAIARTRLAGNRAGKLKWACGDDTERAAVMVENFIRDSRTRPEWKRKPLLAPVLFGLD